MAKVAQVRIFNNSIAGDIDNSLLDKAKQIKQKTPARKWRTKTIVIWSAVVLTILNLLTGYITYGVVAIACMRLPVTATNFASAKSYFVPGQSGYGPNAFREYYCTEQDAQNAGFYKSIR